MKAFETYHPIVLFTYFVSVIGLSIFFMHPIYLAFTLIISCLLNVILHKSKLKSSLWFYIPLFFVTAVANPFFSHNGEIVLFYVNYNPITLEAILYGLAMASMILAVILWFACYNSVMTSDKFIYLFGKISPSLSLIISLSLRLVPKFKKQLYIISNAQRSVGMDYTSGNIIQRMKSVIQIISILITWALENSIETADSMKARGYGLKHRTAFSLFIFTKRDGFILALTLSLLLINILGSIMGYTTYNYYPTFSEINGSFVSMVLYSSYALLLLIPIIIEVREAMIWRLLKSKI
ncbi:energy-coupling factor transporter transmembrane component T [Bacillus sp. JJ722]|uniref:energy-coupling factor transporter transmembrane component T n=1 Tax=Bacillus sp. JJ722 TaxID=3122973 RepID=UPI002FFEAD7C